MSAKYPNPAKPKPLLVWALPILALLVVAMVEASIHASVIDALALGGR